MDATFPINTGNSLNADDEEDQPQDLSANHHSSSAALRHGNREPLVLRHSLPKIPMRGSSVRAAVSKAGTRDLFPSETDSGWKDDAKDEHHGSSEFKGTRSGIPEDSSNLLLRSDSSYKDPLNSLMEMTRRGATDNVAGGSSTFCASDTPENSSMNTTCDVTDDGPSNLSRIASEDALHEGRARKRTSKDNPSNRRKITIRSGGVEFPGLDQADDRAEEKIKPDKEPGKAEDTPQRGENKKVHARKAASGGERLKGFNDSESDSSGSTSGSSSDSSDSDDGLNDAADRGKEVALGKKKSVKTISPAKNNKTKVRAETARISVKGDAEKLRQNDDAKNNDVVADKTLQDDEEEVAVLKSDSPDAQQTSAPCANLEAVPSPSSQALSSIAAANSGAASGERPVLAKTGRAKTNAELKKQLLEKRGQVRLRGPGGGSQASSPSPSPAPSILGDDRPSTPCPVVSAVSLLALSVIVFVRVGCLFV